MRGPGSRWQCGQMGREGSNDGGVPGHIVRVLGLGVFILEVTNLDGDEG